MLRLGMIYDAWLKVDATHRPDADTNTGGKADTKMTSNRVALLINVQ